MSAYSSIKQGPYNRQKQGGNIIHITRGGLGRFTIKIDWSICVMAVLPFAYTNLSFLLEIERGMQHYWNTSAQVNQTTTVYILLSGCIFSVCVCVCVLVTVYQYVYLCLSICLQQPKLGGCSNQITLGGECWNFPFQQHGGKSPQTNRERNKTDRREDPERDDKTERNMEIEIRNMEKMRERHEQGLKGLQNQVFPVHHSKVGLCLHEPDTDSVEKNPSQIHCHLQNLLQHMRQQAGLVLSMASH